MNDRPFRRTGGNPWPRRVQEGVELFAVQPESRGQHGCGVTAGTFDDASFEIAHRPRTDAGAVGQVLLLEASQDAQPAQLSSESDPLVTGHGAVPYVETGVARVRYWTLNRMPIVADLAA